MRLAPLAWLLLGSCSSSSAQATTPSDAAPTCTGAGVGCPRDFASARSAPPKWCDPVSGVMVTTSTCHGHDLLRYRAMIDTGWTCFYDPATGKLEGALQDVTFLQPLCDVPGFVPPADYDASAGVCEWAWAPRDCPGDAGADGKVAD
jgi:hypothetical protein